MTDNLTENVWTRISKEELEQLERAAYQTDMSKSSFIRYCIVRTLRALKRSKPQDK